jgi:putative ABC transport system ATP-binding protein
MIEVKGLRKVYGKKDSTFEALKGVSFTIPDGATAAIVGKSGSKRKQIDHFRAHELGFVFQSFFVEGNQTCYQNVALPLEINQTGIRGRKKLVEAALARVELSDKLKSHARNLSGGQKQRLAIARAIVNHPALIMADEPTGNLDSETGDKIIELLFGLNKKEGSTLIIVTHDADLAARCDMQISIKDGMVVDIIRRRSPHSSSYKGGVRA